jgi:predicted CopG family antitoxin
MATADKQIRVSDRVKRELDRLRREGESYNDVLERVLDDEGDSADFDDGFGRWSDDHAERVREERRAAKNARKQRMRDRADTT